MEVILLQDIQNVGSKNDIIKVKDGFGRNYLIPQRLAIVANESAKKVLAENIKQRAHKEAKLKEEAAKVAEKLQNKQVVIGAKTSSSGKIFGSVNALQIADAIKEQHKLEVDRKKILVNGDSVKEIGTYVAKVMLHKEVTVEVNFEVFAE